MRKLACGPSCRLTDAYTVATQSAGTARARQLAWVIREVHAAHALEAPASQAEHCFYWLSGDLGTEYLAMAAQGALRTRRTSTQPISQPVAEAEMSPSTRASMRVRASCMRQLAALCPEPPDASAPTVGGTPSREPVPETSPRRLLARLSTATTAYGIRSWAVAALAADGLRIHEIAELRMGQLSPDLRRIDDVETKSPGALAPTAASFELSGHSEAALRAWLPARADLVINGRVDHLFITLHPSHTASGVWPAGLPIATRGLARAHRNMVKRWSATGLEDDLTPGQLKAPTE